MITSMTDTKLMHLQPGQEFTLSDERFKTVFPGAAGKKMVASVVKFHGGRMLIQYNGENGCGTLKVNMHGGTAGFSITVHGKSEHITLAELIGKVVSDSAYSMYKYPAIENIRLNVNGKPSSFTCDTEFLTQNPKNIYIKKIRKSGQSYKVPGSALVMDVNGKPVAEFIASRTNKY